MKNTAKDNNINISFKIDKELFNCTEMYLKNLNIDLESYLNLACKQLCQNSNIPFDIDNNNYYWTAHHQITKTMKFIDNGNFIKTYDFFSDIQNLVLNNKEIENGEIHDFSVVYTIAKWEELLSLEDWYYLLCYGSPIISSNNQYQIIKKVIKILIKLSSNFAEEQNIKYQNNNTNSMFKKIDECLWIPLNTYVNYKEQLLDWLCDKKYGRVVYALSNLYSWYEKYIININKNEEKEANEEQNLQISTMTSNNNINTHIEDITTSEQSPVVLQEQLKKLDEMKNSSNI